MMGLVSSNMKKAQSHQKQLYDREAHSRKLEAGEQVLVLLPNPHNSLKLEWVGLYKIVRNISGGMQLWCH